MKNLLVLFLFLLFSNETLPQEKSVSADWKKTDKNLSRIFKGKSVTKKKVDFNQQNLNVEDQLNKNEIFSLQSENEILGFLVITSSMGRFETFQYMVVYNSDLSVKEVNILRYTSSHGGEIASPKWLKQFIGYNGKPLKYGKDIDAISGATFSASSLVKDIEALTMFMKKVIHLPISILFSACRNSITFQAFSFLIPLSFSNRSFVCNDSYFTIFMIR